MRVSALRGGYLSLGFLVTAGLALPALADVAVETQLNGGSQVSLWLHPFLQEDELAMLRMVQSNDQALSIFLPGESGYAALAVAPEEGFLRDGQPVASAVALADLPDSDSANREALAACDALRKGKVACVLVLTVAPG